MTTENIKQIAQRYFAGQTTPDEERQLMAFISESDAHQALFRQWEDAWQAAPEEQPATEEAWQQVTAHITEADAATTQRPARLRVIRRWVAGVAAAIALLLVGAVAARYYMSMEPETFYTSMAPAGSKSCVTLPDGTTVWLNAGSRLTYSTRFNQDNRRVQLDGQGYFEVRHHEGKTFTVGTRGYDVVVRGTKFDVRAYKDESVVNTTLFQGKVDISQNDETQLSLRPGETAVLDVKTGELRKTIVASDAHGWVSGNIDYDNITFNALARILNRQYDVNIHTNSAQIANMRLSVSLHNDETIDDVIGAITLLGNVKVTRHGKDILVH